MKKYVLAISACLLLTFYSCNNEMKKEGALKQNCEADYEVIAKSSALVMVRVDFNYDNCVQQNFLTLEKNADKQWKITQVCKIFNDKDSENTAPKVIAYN